MARKVAGQLRKSYPPGLDFDDAVSEAFIIARKNKARYDAESPPHPEALWMNVRTINDLKDRFDVLRRQSRDFDRGRTRQLREYDPAEIVEKQEDLRTALQILTEDHRAVVLAIYFEGQTQEQVAATRGVSQEAVCQMLARAFEKLKNFLGVDYLEHV